MNDVTAELILEIWESFKQHITSNKIRDQALEDFENVLTNHYILTYGMMKDLAELSEDFEKLAEKFYKDGEEDYEDEEDF